MIPELKLTTCKTEPNTCPAVGDDGHPVFKNPHGWTEKEMENFYDEVLRPKAIAFTVQWMGLAHWMKNHSYSEAVELNK